MKESELYEFVRTLIPDLKMSEFKFSKYDCYSENYRMDIELKCRRAHYDDLLIEWIKYDALMQRAQKFNTKAVYINYTPAGIWAFYLDEFSPEWENRDMPKTTDFSNRQQVSKRVGYLNIEQGRRLR